MFFERKIEAKIKAGLNNEQAQIITGMRRVGKTTLLKKIYATIPENKIWFDFENPLDIKTFQSLDYNDVLENILVKGNLNRQKRLFVFIDEVQHFPEISKIVKYLIDHHQVKFFLTGSASYYLKNLFPESLAGRKFIFELFPLDFEEFLTFKKVNLKTYQKLKKNKEITEVEYELYNKLYDEYLEWGGFPAVVLAKDAKQKEQILNDIFSSYYQNEIIGLADYRKNDKIRDLILLLAARTGSQLDIIKLAQELQTTRTTVYSYLSFLQATYFIHLVSPYSKSVDRRVSGTQKVYFCDNGLLKIMARVNFGQSFENAVFNQLHPSHNINYYRKPSGTEIDFIVDQKEALEIKTTASPIDTERLEKKIKTLKLSAGKIVSKNFVEEQRQTVFAEFL